MMYGSILAIAIAAVLYVLVYAPATECAAIGGLPVAGLGRVVCAQPMVKP